MCHTPASLKLNTLYTEITGSVAYPGHQNRMDIVFASLCGLYPASSDWTVVLVLLKQVFFHRGSAECSVLYHK